MDPKALCWLSKFCTRHASLQPLISWHTVSLGSPGWYEIHDFVPCPVKYIIYIKTNQTKAFLVWPGVAYSQNYRSKGISVSEFEAIPELSQRCTVKPCLSKINKRSKSKQPQSTWLCLLEGLYCPKSCLDKHIDCTLCNGNFLCFAFLDRDCAYPKTEHDSCLGRSREGAQ